MKLRPLRRADAPRIQELVEDPAVRAATTMPDPYPAAGAATWLEGELEAEAAGTAFAFALVTDEGLVGVCAVRDVGGEPRSGTLGYWVGRPYWGRGYASEAVRRTVAHAFGEHGLERLEAACLERHPASRRVLEKNGFRLVGWGLEGHPKWGPDDTFLYFRRDRA